MTVSFLHTALAIGAWLLLRQTLSTDGFLVRAPDPSVAEVFRGAALTASALGSVAAILAGRTVWPAGRALRLDLASLLVPFWCLGVLWLGPWTLETGGAFLIIAVIARAAPGALAVLAGAPAGVAFVTALAVYGAAMLWGTQWSLAEPGVHAATALAAAWTSAAVLSIMRDLFPLEGRTTALAWVLVSALAPLSVLASHAHLAVVGAAVTTTGYRAGFTGAKQRPALGSAAIAVGLLIPAAGALFDPRLGLELGPVTAFPERLPAVFLDRSLGVAATAPWLLIGIAALPGAVERDRRLVPAAIAVVVGLVVPLLTTSREGLWEGIALPPYATVPVVALLAPFVAAGLLAMRSWGMRLVVAGLVLLSGIAAFAMAAIPPLALTSFDDGRLRAIVERLLGTDPLGWLPTLGQMDLRDLGAVAVAVVLVGLMGLAAYPRRRPMIDGVLVHPLERITDARGAIMHMLRVDDPHFERFGEIYFSVVNPGVVKGWHLHSRMTLNYAVPQGRIRLVLYDPREGSPTRGRVQEIPLGGDDYALVRVPAGVWNAFLGLGGEPAIVANCATEPHDPAEIVRKPPRSSDIPYEWGDISPVSG